MIGEIDMESAEEVARLPGYLVRIRITKCERRGVPDPEGLTEAAGEGAVGPRDSAGEDGRYREPAGGEDLGGAAFEGA